MAHETEHWFPEGSLPAFRLNLRYDSADCELVSSHNHRSQLKERREGGSKREKKERKGGGGKGKGEREEERIISVGSISLKNTDISPFSFLITL